jgi:hypothetical protein
VVFFDRLSPPLTALFPLAASHDIYYATRWRNYVLGGVKT